MVELVNIKNSLQDIDEVMDMIYAEWGQFFKSTKQQKIDKILKNINNGSEFPEVFVMKENDVIVGTFTFKERELDGEEFNFAPWLACVVVKPKFRGKGYGKQILKFIDMVASEKYPHLHLITHHTGYYEKIGFQFIKNVEHNGETHRLYAKNYTK